MIEFYTTHHTGLLKTMGVQAYLASSGQAKEGILSRSSDLLLAAGVLAIVALMILPMPTFMLDILVAINIVFGLLLVMMGVYISRPLQFSVFPSVLLISTLFRLSLSVATTRMILLNGDAGKIIDTFGNMVAGGNLVVGMVVFLIITLVQFIVIAKGAERVAEVAARFSLDAMPGKQLSIDSDLRSGLITKDEAKQKRRDLELESKLHGSMDGAMKFVKGDAIAGIVIIIINLLGGLAIGIMMLDMEMGAAMTKYSILTVGDGMVAQVPALLGAMSAGLIVTRATDELNDKHLGDSIYKQFTAIPKVSLVAGSISILLALVPGFPSLVFIIIGIILISVGTLLIPVWRDRFDKVSRPTFQAILRNKEETLPQIKSTTVPDLDPTVPLLLQLPLRWSQDEHSKILIQELNQLMESYQLWLGLPLPKVNVHWHGEEDAGWELFAHEVPIAKGDTNNSQALEAIPAQIRQALRHNATLFLGMQETSTLLTQTSEAAPDVVKEALRVIPMQKLTTILRNLVEEEVPIRNLKLILEAIIEAAQFEKDINNLTEFARNALKRQLCHRYAPQGTLNAILTMPDLDEKLLQSIRVSGETKELALDPQEAQQIIQSLVAATKGAGPVVIITNVQIRRQLRKLIEAHCFNVPVLSHNEILPNISLNIINKIGIPQSQMLEQDRNNLVAEPI